ncbi:hypothetical protein F3K39_34920 [Streptomyces sp. LBUM 1479]|nr:hypothetical protein [Streptomyces sp. LBUM 1485]MBP5933025.1 hypothetical protein [Streptomyces sp. LBUM 1479]QTU57667.1 hypothetical protein F3K21_36845 [Streptomyces sp. LBUM 1480]
MDDGVDSKSAPTKTAASTAAKQPEKLEPIYSPKLETAAGKDAESTSACQLPSSNACARYVADIMDVVRELQAAINDSGRPYEATTEQITKMTDAGSEYVANGCHGDPTADDPNSQCHGAVAVTVGATTLGMTLLTDEAGL